MMDVEWRGCTTSPRRRAGCSAPTRAARVQHAAVRRRNGGDRGRDRAAAPRGGRAPSTPRRCRRWRCCPRSTRRSRRSSPRAARTMTCSRWTCATATRAPQAGRGAERGAARGAAVNAVAPFILNARLKPLMVSVPTHDKHIVNVSAVEGSSTPLQDHAPPPHQMARPPLKHDTRTSAADYHAGRHHMNSVDTGWGDGRGPRRSPRARRRAPFPYPPLDHRGRRGAHRGTRIIDGINTGVHSWWAVPQGLQAPDW